MRELLLTVALLVATASASQACSCEPPSVDAAADWRQSWSYAEAVVLAEVVGESSEGSTSWFSREHVLEGQSPLGQRPLLRLVVRHRWKGDLAANATVVVEKVNGAACGYERWTASRFHLLYVRKARHWIAGMCGPSHPVLDIAAGIEELDARIASFLHDGSKQ